MKHLVILLLSLLSLPLFAADQLTPADRDALTALYNRFHEDTRVGKQSNYPKYLSKDSLEKFVAEHRQFLKSLKTYATADELAKMMRFDPDLKTILAEQDPVKYLSGITPGPMMKAMGGDANIINKVVGIAGDRERAFIVVEGFFDGKYGSTEPFYSVHPAVIEGKEWRLDATSTLVRSLRIKNQQVAAGDLPVGG